MVEQYSPWNLTLCGQKVTYVKFLIYIPIKALICGKQDRSNVRHFTKNVLLLYCTCFVSGCLMITDYELQVTLIRVKRSSSEDINICLCYFSGKCFFIKNKKVIKYIFYEWVKKINILHIFFWLICTSWHHIIYRLTGHFEWCCYAEQQAYKKKE